MSDPLPFQPRFIGQPVPRIEDPLLLTGRARHIDDLQFTGMLHVAMLRSPHAHARIRSVDTSAALELPGVAAVLTGTEIKTMTKPLAGMPSVGPGWTGYAMAVDKVRYTGEIVAAVAASSRYVAEDAVEKIQVDYEMLQPVVDPEASTHSESALLYEEQGSNILFQQNYVYGEPDEALEKAEVIVRGDYRFPRVSGNPLETYGVIACWDTFADELTCWCNCQNPGGSIGGFLADPPGRDHIIAQPHGGSFGTKLYLTKIQLITALLSRNCGGRHVKYIEDRMESLLANGTHAWDRHYEAAFGFTRDGRCTVMCMRTINDSGASAENNAPSMCWKPIVMLTGPYKVEHFKYDLTAVVTNKCPEGAYRGYGCPPHTLVIERLMDKAARLLDLDPVEIRRRNFIQPDEFPYTTPSGTDYDSGDYPALMNLALEKAGYESLRELQVKKRAEGKLVGISAVFGIEPGGVWAMTGPYRDWLGGAAVINPESAAISLNAAGQFEVEVYYALEGQGQYTFACQLVADYFGVPMESVRVRQSDSKNPPPSMGPMGSRQAVVLSATLIGAADKLTDKLKRVASILLQSPVEQLEVHEGGIRLKGGEGPSLPLGQVAATMTFRPDFLPADMDGNPQAMHTWRAEGPADAEGSPYLTYASACHLVMVEIDRATGQTTIDKYVIADDCGTRLNPASVEGQVQGGVAQGIGAALYEEYRYDDYGQPLATTYADYLLPTIHEVPMVEKHAMVTPSPNTALGVKGTGEGAIHVTPAAIFCAVNDALAPLEVELEHANAKPERVWQLIREAADS